MKPTSRDIAYGAWSGLIEGWGGTGMRGHAGGLDYLLGKPLSGTHNFVFAGSTKAPAVEEDMGEQPITVEGRTVEALLVEGQIRDAFLGVFAGMPGLTEAPNALISQAILGQSERLSAISQRVDQIETAIKELGKGIEQFRVQQPSVWVPIQTLAPEPYEVLRPFTVVVRPDGEEFEASFFDANLYGSGDTEEEAISDLKTILIESFERLSELGVDKLGPAMLKQKRVLAAHIRKIG